MNSLSLSDILITLLIFFILLGFFIFIKTILRHSFDKQKVARGNNAVCRKVMREHKRRLDTDYFWSNHMRFSWWMLFLSLSTALMFSIENVIVNLVGLVFLIISIWFLHFAIKSYQAFPAKAAQRLKDFEEQIYAAVKSEICFDADNIQTLSSTDEAFNTEPQVFSFPTDVTKIHFPPYESRVPKQPIIATRKLEFLILSREYFSICKGATTFNLLDPKRAGPPKKCAELPGTAGECPEYYYSQIRNVRYDDKDESIHIIYYHDEDEDIRFPCKKMAPNRKPAMKALKGKLRLTERQRLHKIDEHEQYEKILDRRNNLGVYSTNREITIIDDKKDESSPKDKEQKD